MLGLPSTTVVGRRLPKEAFYKNLELDTRTREEFVHLIERIEVAHSIKAGTANFADGARVHEVLVLDVQLKTDVEPLHAIEAIAAANPHKLVFRTDAAGVVYVLRKGLHASADLETLTLAGQNLDEVWDALCAQVIFGDMDGADLDARIERAQRVAQLEKEIADLDAACWRAKQINRKNELFEQLRARQAELDALRAPAAVGMENHRGH